MHVVGARGGLRKARVVALDEGGQERVGRLHVRDARQPQLLHEPVLQGAVGALDAALRLARVRAQDLDLKLGQGAAELRHAVAALGVLLGHAKDGVLVGVEGNRPSMGRKVALQRLEVRERALGGDEARLHQGARGVVDEDQQRAGRGAVLEPAVLGAVDLDQLAHALAAQPRAMEPTTLRPREPKPVRRHPRPERLPRHLETVLLRQLLSRKRRAEVGVALAHEHQGVVPHAVADAVVGRPPARPVPNRRGALGLEALQKPLRLAPAHAHDHSRARHAHQPEGSSWVATSPWFR